MNNDMVRRDALIRKIECRKVHTDQERETDRQWAIGFNAGIDRALFTLIHAPVVNIEPVRHGEWISVGDDDNDAGMYKCSECGAERYFGEEFLTGEEASKYCRFCPNCGANMDAQEEA